MQYFSTYNWFTQQWEPQSSYCSAMPWATGLQFHYLIADPKVGEQHIKTNCKCNSFQVTPDLLSSDNLKVAITQLCNELQVWNFTML